MARLYLLVFALEILLAVLALISCLSAQAHEVRVLPRFAWAVLIVVFPLVGSVVYFVAGRPLPAGSTGAWRPGMGFPDPQRPQRVLAPDDDPAFLKAIDVHTRRADEELLRRWEEDLKRRDDSPPSDG